MQVYSQDDELIERWQWNDPALRNLSDVVLSLLQGKQGRALDLGCGSGRLAAALARAGFSVDGIDTNEHVIALGQRIIAEEGLDVRLYTGDLFDKDHPVSVGGYDVLVCTEVLEHVGPWQELLQKAGELLCPGGVLVVSVPRDPNQFSVLDSYAGHLRRFRDQELLGELGDSYDQILVRRLGWPFMRSLVWLYTSFLSLSGRKHASQSQALWRKPGRVKRLAVTMFYLVMKIDNLFAWLPLGTTLVVRARKRSQP